ncbi:MAG TPA: DUF3102 domain-containing protein [Pseudolabrys sp.]
MSSLKIAQKVIEDAATIDSIADAIRDLRQNTGESILQMGALLVKAKRKIGHGEWGYWLRHEFAWSQDTAERMMNTTRAFGSGNSALVRNLEPTALIELAKSSTPAEARETVESLVKDGTVPSAGDVRRIIRAARGSEEPSEPREPPVPQERPSVRKAALADQFKAAIGTLMALSTKPANTFAGAVQADDLDMLGNFLKQIAAVSRAK